jgi:protein SCO1/2
MKTTTLILMASLLFATVSCDKKTAQNTSQPATQSSAKHYKLKGKVVSLDKQSKMVNVDSETISGFMEAMTMPYKVKPESELDNLHPGDLITADLIVQDEGAGAWIENIVVTGHSAAAPKTSKLEGAPS